MPDSPPLLRLRSLRSYLGLFVLVFGGLIALFALAGRRTPEAWRRKLEEAGETLVLEELRDEVPDEQNAALQWRELERRCATGDPGFLRCGNLPGELRRVGRGFDETLGALFQGSATDSERGRLAAGLDLVRDELDRLDPLLDLEVWSFDEPRATWDPRSRTPVYEQVLPGSWAARVMNLGTRGPQLDLAISWSCVRAVLAAEAGAPAEAARSLRLARHLIDALRSEPHAPELAARVWLEFRFIDAVEACLPALEPDDEARALEQRLGRLDSFADLAAVLRSRRIEMLEWFERERCTPVPAEGPRRWVHGLAFGLDVQAVANTFETCLQALESSPTEALSVGVSLSRPSWRRTWLTPSIDSIVGSGLGVFPVWILYEIQMRNDLLRIALADRLHGREAALARASELVDLVTGSPLPRATKADGSTRFWSVGRNERDEDGAGDDLTITLPPRD